MYWGSPHKQMCAGVARFSVTNMQQGETCRCLHGLCLCIGPVMGITQTDLPESWILTDRTPHLWGARVLLLSTLSSLRAEFCTTEIAEEHGKEGELHILWLSTRALQLCAWTSPQLSMWQVFSTPCLPMLLPWRIHHSVGKCWKMTFRSWMAL